MPGCTQTVEPPPFEPPVVEMEEKRSGSDGAPDDFNDTLAGGIKDATLLPGDAVQTPFSFTMTDNNKDLERSASVHPTECSANLAIGDDGERHKAQTSENQVDKQIMGALQEQDPNLVAKLNGLMKTFGVDESRDVSGLEETTSTESASGGKQAKIIAMSPRRARAKGRWTKIRMNRAFLVKKIRRQVCVCVRRVRSFVGLPIDKHSWFCTKLGLLMSTVLHLNVTWVSAFIM